MALLSATIIAAWFLISEFCCVASERARLIAPWPADVLLPVDWRLFGSSAAVQDADHGDTAGFHLRALAQLAVPAVLGARLSGCWRLRIEAGAVTHLVWDAFTHEGARACA